MKTNKKKLKTNLKRISYLKFFYAECFSKLKYLNGYLCPHLSKDISEQPNLKTKGKLNLF
jgi:hypothetical protein